MMTKTNGGALATPTISELAQRLRKARVNAGYPSALAASNAHGWAQKTYSDHEGGRRHFRHMAEMYKNAFNLSDKYFVGAEDEPLTATVAQIDFTSIPGNSLAKLIRAKGKTPLALCKSSPECFSITNIDRAMTSQETPRFLPNDILIFDPRATIRAGDYVLAWIDGHEEPIFRLFYPKGKDGAVYQALNPSIQELKISKRDQWRILARLQFLVRPVETLG